MATEQKPLMIRGDRLLFALEALAFFRRSWEYTDDLRDLLEQNSRYNPCNLSYRAVRRILDHKRFYGIGSALNYIAWEVARQLLRSVPTTVLETITLDAYTIFVYVGLRWLPDERPRNIGLEKSTPVFRFLSAIASGELTEADFRE